MGTRKEFTGGGKRKVALIACSKTKLKGIHPARHLYQGELFKKALAYCSQNYDQVFILSAKYGLLEPDQMISDYDVTLKTKTESEKKQWSEKVRRQLKEKGIADNQITCFAGKDYNKYIPGIKYFDQFENFSIGKQLSFFKSKLQRKGLFDD